MNRDPDSSQPRKDAQSVLYGKQPRMPFVPGSEPAISALPVLSAEQLEVITFLRHHPGTGLLEMMKANGKSIDDLGRVSALMLRMSRKGLISIGSDTRLNPTYSLGPLFSSEQDA